MHNLPASLKPSLSNGGEVTRINEQTWRLAIPAGPARSYRLAQLDDYSALPRRRFAWQPGLSLVLQARSSDMESPGTWGFGLWNDPFSMGILGGGALLRLPALPNAAWFFFASPQNYLSLRDDLPSQGSLASAFCTPRWPSALLALGAPVLPLLAIPAIVRLVRRLGRRIVRQAAAALPVYPTEWHTFRIEWISNLTSYQVDGQTVLQTSFSPLGPLGLVIWIDNQYAALLPSGRMHYGMLPTSEPAWIEVRDLEITSNTL